jgi:hypothetical protein
MSTSRLRPLTLPLAGLLLAACSGATPSPSPEPTPPADAAFLLRVTTVQALPPRETFGRLPSIVIALDGRVLTGGAVPAIFPGPLVMPIIEQRLSPAGWAKIVEAARAAGLLSGATDFTGGQMPPGSAAARLQIVAGGHLYEVTGDPSRIMVCIKAPCVPPAGTPEAFAGFLGNLGNLEAWLAADLGQQGMYQPAAFVIIAGPPPDQQDLEQPILPWPLADGFAAFGKPLADGSGSRCGAVSGDTAAALQPALAAANQLTRWREPVDGSLHGLTVRPLLPGDGDPCAGLVQA